MNTLPRPLRSVIVLAGALALSFAGWACAGGKGGAGSANGEAGSTSGNGGSCAGAGGSADAGSCLSPSAAPSPPPKKTCDPCKDVYKECPLPATQMMPSNGSFSAVYYFSDPVCESGVCSYCVTRTETEDPCATAVCH